jgi:hypothetical protein
VLAHGANSRVCGLAETVDLAYKEVSASRMFFLAIPPLGDAL